MERPFHIFAYFVGRKERPSITYFCIWSLLFLFLFFYGIIFLGQSDVCLCSLEFVVGLIEAWSMTPFFGVWGGSMEVNSYCYFVVQLDGEEC